MTFTAGGSQGPPAVLSITWSLRSWNARRIRPKRAQEQEPWNRQNSSQFNSMTKLSTELKEELLALLPPTIFFLWPCISWRREYNDLRS